MLNVRKTSIPLEQYEACWDILGEASAKLQSLGVDPLDAARFEVEHGAICAMGFSGSVEEIASALESLAVSLREANGVPAAEGGRLQ